MNNFTDLPANLPIPSDDGACRHLVGMLLPSLSLPATTGTEVDLSAERAGWTTIFCYPMTGRPGVALPEGWDDIPGARGCTPQACSFRDHMQSFIDRDVTVFGLSTQTPSYQHEMAERLHLPYAVLSDAELAFTNALRLPTFTVDGIVLIKRLTLIVRDGRIAHVLYPVFPTNQSAEQTLAWLDGRGSAEAP
jgi:peroxiredoxin